MRKVVACALIWLCFFSIAVAVSFYKSNDVLMRLTVDGVKDSVAAFEINGMRRLCAVNPKKNSDNLYVSIELDKIISTDAINLNLLNDEGVISSFKIMSCLGFCKFDIISSDIEPSRSVSVQSPEISGAIKSLNIFLLLSAGIVASLAVSAVYLISSLIEYIRANKRACSFIGSIIQVCAYERTSIFAIPWMVSMIMTYYLLMGVSMSKQHYFGGRCCLLAILFTLGWMATFVVDQYKLAKGKDCWSHIQCRLVIVLVLAYFVGTYFAYPVWGYWYQSVFPYDALNIGMSLDDVLFHSAIAESFSHSIFPSNLLNDEHYIHYHTFSHLLMYIVSVIIRVPAFAVYNYLYPVLFLPTYSLSAFLAIACAKKYFVNRATIHYFDLIFVVLFFVGIIDNPGRYMVNPYIVYMSESTLISNIELFLALALLFCVLRNLQANRQLIAVYSAIIVPAEIFVISWTKISAGLLFTAGAIYFVFRSRPKSFVSLLLNILYGFTFLVCVVLFNSVGAALLNGASTPSYGSGKWLAIARDFCPGPLGIFGHWLIICFFALLYVVFDAYKNRYTWGDLKIGKTIWLELTVFVIAIGILAQFPPLGHWYALSARYFTLAAMIPSLVLLCAHNYIDSETGLKEWGGKTFLYFLLCGWCIWVGYHQRTNVPSFHNSKPIPPFSHPLTRPTQRSCFLTRSAKDLNLLADKRLCETLMSIRGLVDNNPKDFTIYLDSDSIVDAVYPKLQAPLYVCPALTKVGVINATYFHEGKHFSFADKPVSNYFVDGDNSKLTYNQAMTLAKQRGKKKLIHITKSGYEVVNLITLSLDK